MQINLNTIFKLLATLLIVSLIALFCSCSAKKTDKTSQSEISKLEITDLSKNDKSTVLENNIKSSEKITVNDQDKTTTVEETIEPVDTSKPAIYTDKNGQKQELHNTKKTTKTTIKNNNTKTEIAFKKDNRTNIVQNEKQQTNIKKAAKTKKVATAVQVDRKALPLWNLRWLLVIVPVYLVWKNWSKITSKIWWI